MHATATINIRAVSRHPTVLQVTRVEHSSNDADSIMLRQYIISKDIHTLHYAEMQFVSIISDRSRQGFHSASEENKYYSILQYNSCIVILSVCATE
jgi:hypothetical protein